MLNQSTQAKVANSTASRLRHGPRRRMTSVLKSPITDSARALTMHREILAAIAVVHKARERIAAARVDRLFQRVEDEVRAHRGGHPPADDAPREHIDDEGDIDEPGPGRHVGEVRHPQLSRSRGRELLIDEIGRSRGRHPGAPADGAGQAPRAHQPAHRAARHVKALAPQRLPDLPWAVHLERLVPAPLDLRLRGVITLRPRGATCGIEPAHAMAMICRGGDPHHRADRLDPIRVPVIVDESDGHLPRRSSSAWAKYADAFRKISLVRFSSRFSRSNSFRRCRSSVVSPARWPRSRSAWRTHLRRVSAVQPNLLAIEPIAAHWDGYSGPSPAPDGLRALELQGNTDSVVPWAYPLREFALPESRYGSVVQIRRQPSLRHNVAMLSSPRSASSTIRIFSSAEKPPAGLPPDVRHDLLWRGFLAYRTPPPQARQWLVLSGPHWSNLAESEHG